MVNERKNSYVRPMIHEAATNLKEREMHLILREKFEIRPPTSDSMVPPEINGPRGLFSGNCPQSTGA